MFITILVIAYKRVWLLLTGYALLIIPLEDGSFEISFLAKDREIQAFPNGQQKAAACLMAMGLILDATGIKKLIQALEIELELVRLGDSREELVVQLIAEEALPHLSERLSLVLEGYQLSIGEFHEQTLLELAYPEGLYRMECRTILLSESLERFSQEIGEELRAPLVKLLRLEEERFRLFGASPQFLQELQNHLETLTA